MLRNCVNPETGRMILDCALKKEPKRIINSLFDNEFMTL